MLYGDDMGIVLKKIKDNKLKEYLKTNFIWIICFFSILLFILITHITLSKEILNIDTVIFKVIRSIESPGVTVFFKTVTQFASFPVFLILCCLILIFLKRKLYFWIIGLNLVNVSVLNYILKIIFRRPRPSDFTLITETGFSFPSGHSMASLAFYGLLIYLIHRSELKKNKKIILTTILSVIIVLVGISRIYLGVHYTSDVIGGFCFGISYIIIFVEISKKIIKKI